MTSLAAFVEKTSAFTENTALFKEQNITGSCSANYNIRWVIC
jgi:hypothetical protein